MKIMLIANQCPMCGKVNSIKLIGNSIEEWMDYTFNGGHIQDKMKSIDPFGREFIKTGYCPKCQESLFCNTCENMDQFILSDDIDTEKLTAVRDGIYSEIQSYEDSGSEWGEKFTQKVISNPTLTNNEKLVIIQCSNEAMDGVEITEDGKLTYVQEESYEVDESYPDPDMEKIMNISSKHITKEMIRVAKMSNIPVYESEEHCFVFVPAALNQYSEDIQMVGFKKIRLIGFKKILDYADKYNCDWIHFSDEGQVIDELQVLGTCLKLKKEYVLGERVQCYAEEFGSVADFVGTITEIAENYAIVTCDDGFTLTLDKDTEELFHKLS